MSRTSAFLIFLTLLGWSAFWVVGAFELFGEAPKISEFIFGVGLTLTAITMVVFLAQFFLCTILRDAFQVEPSGLIHAIIYSTLTSVAAVILLSQFGVDVGAILTTSAIVGAVVGLSMQSTLGSIIAGMSMSAEPLLKIGSAIRFENRTVTIEQKTWHHVVGRRLDNIRVIIPNSMLANMPILVLPEDGPTRFDVFIHLPPDVPPQRVTDLLSEAFADIEHLDATRAVMVTPIETQPEIDSIRYRIRLWARVYTQVTILEGEVLRRAWYVLGRAKIYQPRYSLYQTAKWVGLKPDVAENLVRLATGKQLAPAGLKNIRQYRFAPAEVLHFPQSEIGRVLMVVKGQASENSNPYLNPIEHGWRARAHLPQLNVQRLSAAAIVRKVADRLAQDAGPIAEQLVRDAIKHSQDLNGALTVLSMNIVDETKRSAFLTGTRALVGSQLLHDNGTVLNLTLNAVGRVLPDPELRAVSEVLAITFPQPL
jgi:small-conductance mechanosensitive channel